MKALDYLIGHNEWAATGGAHLDGATSKATGRKSDPRYSMNWMRHRVANLGTVGGGGDEDEDMGLTHDDMLWIRREFTGDRDSMLTGEPLSLREAIWELIVRGVNSTGGVGTRDEIDRVDIGEGSPLRGGIKDAINDELTRAGGPFTTLRTEVDGLSRKLDDVITLLTRPTA